MRFALITVLITAVFYLFALMGSFTHWGVPWFRSQQERAMAFTSLSDLIQNNPPIFRKRVRQSWLYFGGTCFFLAARYWKSGHVEQYAMRTAPGQFWSYVGYWFVLGFLSLFLWLRGRQMTSHHPP
jgi:hypothetical protein